jgi:hypothetical protein
MDPMTFEIKYFNETISQGLKLTSIANPISVDSDGNNIRLPSFVNFD